MRENVERNRQIHRYRAKERERIVDSEGERWKEIVRVREEKI